MLSAAERLKKSVTILRVADNDKAVNVLQRNGITPVCQDELAAL